MKENKVKEFFESLPDENKNCLRKIYREEEKNIAFGVMRESEMIIELKKIIEGEIK